MKAALDDNRKNLLFIARVEMPCINGTPTGAGYKLGCPSNSSSIDKWIKYAQ